MGNNTIVGDWKRFRSEEKPSAFKVISRGWMNAQNRRSHYCKDTIEPGVIYGGVKMKYALSYRHWAWGIFPVRSGFVPDWGGYLHDAN